MHGAFTAAHLPHWPILDTTTPPPVGGAVKGWGLGRCSINSRDHDLYFVGGGDEQVSMLGAPTHVATYKAASPHDGVPRDDQTEWMRKTGLVVWAHWLAHDSHDSADLVDPDAA